MTASNGMIGEAIAQRYRLEGELGRGGMATVFLARDERLGRAVALKLMHPSLPVSSRDRFRREAEIVASLKHRNILEIHDVGEDPARGPWMVTELVEGQNLRDWMKQARPVSALAAAIVGWELALALGEAHARGVVHRDVKPENVLWAREGRLKLADFGIAALHDQERLTSTGAITGSLAYMAPERLDDGRFNAASDVYAVGVILFELCAGHTPFGGRGAAHLAAAVLTQDAPALTDVAPAVPSELSALVARCLCRDEHARFENGGALAAALEAFVAAQGGSPADASRRLLADPVAENERLRERDFQRLLDEARALLEAGQGARASRLLDAALVLRPGSVQVRELLFGAARRRRRLRAWLGFGGAALAVAAAVAVFVSRAPSAPPPAPVAVAEAPIAPPEEAAAPEPAAAPLAVQAPVAPAHTRKQPAATRPLTAPKEAPSSRSPAPGRSVSPVASAPGTLLLATKPWAEVFVGGKSLGYTPKVRTVSLPAGDHVVRLQNPHCEPHEETITIPSGGEVVREVALVLKKASLTVRAPPGTALFVDGVEVGAAPLTAPLQTAHGRHSISAILPDGRRVSRDVTLVAGETSLVILEGE